MLPEIVDLRSTGGRFNPTVHLKYTHCFSARRESNGVLLWMVAGTARRKTGVAPGRPRQKGATRVEPLRVYSFGPHEIPQIYPNYGGLQGTKFAWGDLASG